MKTFLLAFVLLFAGLAVSAQNMAKDESESIATYLSLSNAQKQAVKQLYNSEEDKIRQSRESARTSHRTSSADRTARENAAAKKTSHASSRPKVKHGSERPTVSASEHTLRVAYGKAKRNPAIQQGMKDILTPAQFTKWNSLGKK